MSHSTSRRDFLKAAGGAAVGLGAAVVIRVEPAHATPAEMQEAMRTIIGSAPVRRGKVKLELPPLIENGNAVPLTVSVDRDRKSTRLNSSHSSISYAVFCLKKKKNTTQ